MHAVEFDADIKNGIVYIPKEYEELRRKKSARFVVMYDDVSLKVKYSREDMQRMDSVDMIFDKYSIDMSKIRFDREETHDR